MRRPMRLELGPHAGWWGDDPATGLWAEIDADGVAVTVGDSAPELRTLGALAAAVDSHDDSDRLEAGIDDILVALEQTWVPVAGAATWTTMQIGRRDAARHLVAHHGMPIVAAARYCHCWPEDIVELPVRDRLEDPVGGWWITDSGHLARTYGRTELSDADVDAHRPANATYALVLMPGVDLPYVGTEMGMSQMSLWSPVEASTATEVLVRWGRDPGEVRAIDENITRIR